MDELELVEVVVTTVGDTAIVVSVAVATLPGFGELGCTPGSKQSVLVPSRMVNGSDVVVRLLTSERVRLATVSAGNFTSQSKMFELSCTITSSSVSELMQSVKGGWPPSHVIRVTSHCVALVGVAIDNDARTGRTTIEEARSAKKATRERSMARESMKK